MEKKIKRNDWEITLPPVSTIPIVFKYLGEHYGLLVFISSDGNTFTATPDGDNSFLEIGKEYDMRLTNTDTGQTFSFPFTSTGALDS